MSLRFPYKLYSSQRPIFTLGGRFVRPRPVLHVGVAGPNLTRVVEVLLDTGADDTVFNDSVAAVIGVNLSGGRARVGLTPVQLPRALFGFAGFLRFFTTTFHGDREEVELTANALLPPP